MKEIVEKAATESENGHVRQLLEETLQAGWRRLEEREEKKEKARKKRDEWELKRIARLITTGVMEDAVSRSEMKHIEHLIEDTLHEGWRRVETKRLLRLLEETEDEVQERVIKACLRKREEERNMLDALRMEEDRQRRLERTRTLKLILRKKLGAQSLRSMMNLMKEMSLEELGMEVDEVENRAREMMEMMETCDSADDHSDYQEVKYENMVVENTEVSTEDVYKIAYNNMRIQDLAQIGQENIQKSKIEITPLMTIPKVEMKPTFKNVFYPEWYLDNILLPFPGQRDSTTGA